MIQLPNERRRLHKPSVNVVFLLSIFVLASAAIVISAFGYQSQSPPQSQSQGANSAAPAQQFIATWRGDLKGKPFAFVQITSTSPKVVGVVCTAPGINVGPSGEVDEFWWPAKLTDARPMLEPKLEGNRLSFTFKTEDADHPDTFEMVLTNPDEATLRPVRTFDNQAGRFLTDEEIAKQVKPFHLKKVDGTAKKD